MALSVEDRKALLAHGQLKAAAESIGESPKFGSAVLHDKAFTYSRTRVVAMQTAIAIQAGRTRDEMFGGAP
jgi:hypothetical protein